MDMTKYTSLENKDLQLEGNDILVFTNFGIQKMLCSEFSKFDENMQVSCGEGNIHFEIYFVVTYFNQQLTWKGAQDYFKEAE